MNKPLISTYLCFERDLFLRILKREHERDRRGRLERLEERLFVPTEMGRAASATQWIKVCVVLMLKHVVKFYTWLYGGCDRGLGFPHPLHHAFQLFSSSLRRHLWRFDDSIVGVINPETHITLYSELVDHTEQV